MKHFVSKIEEAVALLICSGHRDAWDYGYSFFKTALRMLNVMQQQQTWTIAKGVGIGVGLVLSGKLDEVLKEEAKNANS